MGIIKKDEWEEGEEGEEKFEEDGENDKIDISLDEKKYSERPVLVEVISRREYLIPLYPLIIGRERKSTICIPVPAISRKHSKIFEKDGIFYVEDLASMNGTFLNDKRVFDPTPMNNGDKIKVGVTKAYPKGVKEFIFRIARSEEDKIYRDVAKVKAKEIIEQEKIEEEIEKVVESSGVEEKKESKTTKISLRHCIFQVAKKGVFSSQPSYRVPLTNISMDKISFLTLHSHKVGEGIQLSIEHPRVIPSIQINIQVDNVSSLDFYGLIKVDASVSKFTPSERARFTSLIEITPLIDYLGKEDKS